MKATPPPTTHSRVTLDQVRQYVSSFEETHPGFHQGNYPDAFRDEQGQLDETEEFLAVDGWYALLDASA